MYASKKRMKNSTQQSAWLMCVVIGTYYACARVTFTNLYSLPAPYCVAISWLVNQGI